jgi:acetyl-CoA carboxylase biotin carboxyl carrier protein
VAELVNFLSIRTHHSNHQVLRGALMNIKEVKDLIHDVLQSDISEFEFEHSGTSVKLRRGLNPDLSVASPTQAPPHTNISPSLKPDVSEAALPSFESQEGAADSQFHIITSPIVGTFYRAASPEAEPYVRLGDQIEEGSILCIVEAMKLMNEIPSDINGEVVRIYVENGNPVEFGQKLFAILPRKQG